MRVRNSWSQSLKKVITLLWVFTSRNRIRFSQGGSEKDLLVAQAGRGEESHCVMSPEHSPSKAYSLEEQTLSEPCPSCSRALIPLQALLDFTSHQSSRKDRYCWRNPCEVYLLRHRSHKSPRFPREIIECFQSPVPCHCASMSPVWRMTAKRAAGSPWGGALREAHRGGGRQSQGNLRHLKLLAVAATTNSKHSQTLSQNNKFWHLYYLFTSGPIIGISMSDFQH